MQSLFEKIWAQHVVAPETDDTPAVLYVDLHLLHEVTTPQAFDLLRAEGLARTAHGSLPRDARSLDADGARQDAEGSRDRQRAVGREASAADGAELQGFRHRAARLREPRARHRARHGSRARRDAARRDDRLRRLAHEHARRVRRPRLRHRHDRSRPRARDAVLAAAQAEDARDQRRRQAAAPTSPRRT